MVVNESGRQQTDMVGDKALALEVKGVVMEGREMDRDVKEILMEGRE